jgi:hypothetical protein
MCYEKEVKHAFACPSLLMSNITDTLIILVGYWLDSDRLCTWLVDGYLVTVVWQLYANRQTADLDPVSNLIEENWSFKVFIEYWKKRICQLWGKHFVEREEKRYLESNIYFAIKCLDERWKFCSVFNLQRKGHYAMYIYVF